MGQLNSNYLFFILAYNKQYKEMISVFRPLTQSWSVDVNSADKISHTIENLTRDIEIKPLHSHNDYWRKQPLFDALSHGCQSIESDIWYFPEDYEVERTVTETTRSGTENKKIVSSVFKNNEIYVGHNQVYLDPSLTLSKLYLDPLYHFLEYSNPEFIYKNTPLVESLESKHGVFFNSPETPLYFWLDFKTDPHDTYKTLKPLLQRFIDRDFLAYYDTVTGKFVPGPIVITITGNAPVDEIEKETKRYVFVDAPLSKFKKNTPPDEIEKYSQLSVIASASMQELIGDDNFKRARANSLSETDEQALDEYFQVAHKYNLKTRIWGGITWPNHVRNSHLRTLWQLGCDLLNVDDLHDASEVF